MLQELELLSQECVHFRKVVVTTRKSAEIYTSTSRGWKDVECVLLIEALNIWGRKCPHDFLSRDVGVKDGFYWQMANSKGEHCMFLMGFAHPGLGQNQDGMWREYMASIVELSLGYTTSYHWIQLFLFP
jgi:hypothetical protein